MNAILKSPIVCFVLPIMIISAYSTEDKEMKLNDIQIIGSHNSYKQAIEKPVMALILSRDSNGIALDYYHLPLQEQLDLGLRGLEIDVLHDPTGGRYNEPLALKLLKGKGVPVNPFDSANQLSIGGLKVLHVPDIDFRSHCLTFKACLQEIKDWSDKNRGHIPIIITVNPKISGISEPGYTPVLPFTRNVLDSLDQEILSVIPFSSLITPEVVQGKYSSLREAIKEGGWPSLESCKGKILFVLDADLNTAKLYAEPSLKGKPMFANLDENHPDAVFFIMNDPKQQLEAIREKVKTGYMVRTRADADTREARTNDLTRLEAAINSGAQVISTDYYLSRLSPSGNFQVSFPGDKYVVCNPVTAPVKCSL